MPDDHGERRWTTAAPRSLSGARTQRGLTVAEIQEFAALRVMMRRDAYMTEAQCRRWFELWQRHDLMHG
jgi:hypothetical protein